MLITNDSKQNSQTTQKEPEIVLLNSETLTSSNANQSQSNIVFILVDDIGIGGIGFNGSDIAAPD